MTFQINQRVAYPGFGLGRIAGIVTKCLSDAESLPYYEVVGEHSTLWVPVREAAARGLRRLTQQGELPRYRGVLRAAPADLEADPHLRYRDVQARLKRGTLQDLCEVVRDLTAHRGRTPLGAYDVLALEKSRRWLCQEWAMADGVPAAQAAAEVTDLLRPPAA